MKVLVIGGTGTISADLTRQLVARGDEVTVFNRGVRAEAPEGAATVLGDRYAYAEFESRIRSLPDFDVVIEMITYTGEHALSLRRAFQGRCKQIVFCSTVDVYARPASRYPYTEAEPLVPLSDYAKNKVAAENCLREGQDKGEFELTVLRPAHTYSDRGSIVHTFGWRTTFIDRLRKSKPVVVHGDGQSLWASCHATDVSTGFVGACGNERAFGGAYHLAGERWMTWNVYVQMVAEAARAPKPTIVHIPTDLLMKWGPERAAISYFNFQYPTIFDSSAAKQALGFSHSIPWSEGARRIIHDLDSRGGPENGDLDPFDDQIIERWLRSVSEG